MAPSTGTGISVVVRVCFRFAWVMGTTLGDLRMPHPRWDEKADRRWTSDTLSSNRTRQGARKDRFVKKNSTVKRNLKKGATKTTKEIQESIMMVVNIGNQASRYCVLNGTGEVKEEGSVPTSK